MNEHETMPREVVLTYDSAEEVVLTYRQETPLPDYPGHPRWEEPIPRKRRRRKWLIIGLSLLLIAVLAAVGYSLLPQDKPAPEKDHDPDDRFWSDVSDEESQPCTIPLYEGTDTAEMILLPLGGKVLTPQQVYQTVNPAVVTVLGYASDGQSVGTGILFSENGFLLTNAHVIDGCTAAVVVLASGYTFDATMVGYDYDEDLAVLKIESDGQPFPVAVFGNSDELWVGEPAYAIGNPLGVDLRGTFTSGMISGLSREIDLGGITLSLLQTDAALNSGNSGGPLINKYGQVIGINTAKMQSRYSSVEGIGLAIPTADAQEKINALILYGEIPPTPTIGITIAPMETLTEDGHLGLEVWEVTPGGAGDLAGILPGDVVVRADGKELLVNQDLLDARNLHEIGETIELEICRDGEHFTAQLTLQSSKQDK